MTATGTHTLCSACGVPSSARLCPDCHPASPLLAEDARERLRALRGLGPEQRRFVVLVALRGWRLWPGVRHHGLDLGEALLGWLMANRCTITWARWIAEDAVYGSVSWTTLIQDDDFDRTLLRIPLWLASGNAFKGSVWTALGRENPNPDRYAAFEARLGSSGVPPKRIRAALEGQELIVRELGRHAVRGDHSEMDFSWTPDSGQLVRASQHRRWPIERIEPDGIVCCTICGECLPAEGGCSWCGTDPEQEPPTLLPAAELFTQRPLCPVCSIDYTHAIVPVLCPGCGTEFDWSS